jgi:hypothetical protein
LISLAQLPHLPFRNHLPFRKLVGGIDDALLHRSGRDASVVRNVRFWHKADQLPDSRNVGF